MTSPAGKNAKKLKNESGAAVPVGEAKAEPKLESKKEKKKKEKKDSPVKPDGTQPASEKEKNSSTPSGAEKAQKPVMKEHSGGLKTKDVKVGTGKQAKAGNMISMRYIFNGFPILFSDHIIDTLANYLTARCSTKIPRANRYGRYLL